MGNKPVAVRPAVRELSDAQSAGIATSPKSPEELFATTELNDMSTLFIEHPDLRAVFCDYFVSGHWISTYLESMTCDEFGGDDKHCVSYLLPSGGYIYSRCDSRSANAQASLLKSKSPSCQEEQSALVALAIAVRMFSTAVEFVHWNREISEREKLANSAAKLKTKSTSGTFRSLLASFHKGSTHRVLPSSIHDEQPSATSSPRTCDLNSDGELNAVNCCKVTVKPQSLVSNAVEPFVPLSFEDSDEDDIPTGREAFFFRSSPLTASPRLSRSTSISSSASFSRSTSFGGNKRTETTLTTSLREKAREFLRNSVKVLTKTLVDVNTTPITTSRMNYSHNEPSTLCSKGTLLEKLLTSKDWTVNLVDYLTKDLPFAMTVSLAPPSLVVKTPSENPDCGNDDQSLYSGFTLPSTTHWWNELCRDVTRGLYGSEDGSDRTGNGLNQKTPVVLVNQAFESLTQHCRSEVVGQSVHMVLENEEFTEMSQVERIRNAVFDARPLKIAISSVKKSGDRFFDLRTMQPIVCPKTGSFKYIVTVHYDLSGNEERFGEDLQGVDMFLQFMKSLMV